ncbi:MAG: hypothetical protein FMNOHCHN_03802 [Ignavibacteriaceae bacterium]|nr:hypothetical protein [Ignavibacteriaceae bacterium]
MKRQQDIAYELAEKAHQGQTRRDGITPYFNHVKDVARVAGDRFGFDDELIATALCHDLLEQCGISEIKMFDAGLSQAVIEAVQWLTLNRERSYEENIRAIKNSKNPLAIKVKIADNLANLADSPTDKQILKYAKSLQILLS